MNPIMERFQIISCDAKLWNLLFEAIRGENQFGEDREKLGKQFLIAKKPIGKFQGFELLEFDQSDFG